MGFEPINLNAWERAEHYRHFMEEVPCGYSVTVELDITNLAGQRLYPAMLWLITHTVNEFPAFRTALTDKGPGVYGQMHPAYTVFNEERKTFSGIWTAFDEDYGAFLKAYERDVAQYASSTAYEPKPGRPENSFDISMIPWAQFTSFNLNFFGGSGKYLLPIFTMGKAFMRDGKRMLPLAVQVHHAVCDGYHVGMFVESLQRKINGALLNEPCVI